MAGLSFLYAYFNLYSMGGGHDVPSIDDAMMDIESCLGVLEFLARKFYIDNESASKLMYLIARVPSAAACHDTMRTLSQAIFKQLSDLDPPHTTVSSSPNRRSLLRGAPISSSREDPLPNVFPAPLPAVALPYELSLLDNLFRNPMASHNKASDYTSNKLCGKRKAEAGGYHHSTPSSMPSRAFHLAGEYPASQSVSGHGNGPTADPSTVMGTFGMAAHLNLHPESNLSVFPPSSGPNLSTLANTAAAAAAGSFAPAGEGSNGAMLNVDNEQNGFDIFSFLMDDEGGLGTNGFSLDVPADFSLWG